MNAQVTSLASVAEATSSAIVALTDRPANGIVIAPNRVLVPGRTSRGTTTIGVAFADGRRVNASVFARDRRLRAAILEVDTPNVTPLAPTDVEVAIGTPILAISNPEGAGLHAAPGVITSIERGGRPGTFEHSAPLPEGSYGSAVVDLDGRLVGVNVMRSDAGLTTALRVDAERWASLTSLASGQTTPRREIGVGLMPGELSRRMRRAVGLADVPGLLVRVVREGTPAAATDIAAGDLLTAIDDTPVATIRDVYGALSQSGDRAVLHYTRGVEERTSEVSWPKP